MRYQPSYSFVVKDLRLEDKDKDLKIDPRGHGLPSRTVKMTGLYGKWLTYFIISNILISESKLFFTVTSCTVVVTKFMGHVIIHNRPFAECEVVENFWSKDKDL